MPHGAAKGGAGMSDQVTNVEFFSDGTLHVFYTDGTDELFDPNPGTRWLQAQLALARPGAEGVRRVVDAAIEFESYLAKINTPERQSIVFQCPEDDADGLALIGFCERLTKLSQAIRALDLTRLKDSAATKED